MGGKSAMVKIKFMELFMNNNLLLKGNHGETKYLCDLYIFLVFRLYILHTSEYAPLQGERCAKMADSGHVVTERHCAVGAYGKVGGGGCEEV